VSGLTLFRTGATGFIGGSVLNKLLEKHPQLEIKALLRSPSSAFSAKYSSVEVVKGSFDDFGIIEKVAHEADIVIRRLSPFLQLRVC
jgi:nucleoside-diphosphate-sugar epimerase